MPIYEPFFSQAFDLYSFIIGTTPGQLTIYYLSLQFINNKDKTATVTWIENGNQINLDISPKSPGFRESVFSSQTTPLPVQIRAVEKGTTIGLLLNGQSSFQVAPTEMKKVVTINIGESKFE